MCICVYNLMCIAIILFITELSIGWYVVHYLICVTLHINEYWMKYYDQSYLWGLGLVTYFVLELVCIHGCGHPIFLQIATSSN